jgi:hypothetical protein
MPSLDQRSLIEAQNKELQDGVDGALSILGVMRVRALQYGSRDVDDLFNVTQFLFLFLYDYSVLTSDFLSSDDDRRRSLYARILSMLMLEAFDDFGHLLGRRLRRLLERAKAPAQLYQQLNAVHGGITALSRKHRKELSQVRNISIAHREHDVLQQLPHTHTSDLSRFLELTRDFHVWTINALECLLEVLKKACEPLIEIEKRGLTMRYSEPPPHGH